MGFKKAIHVYKVDELNDGLFSFAHRIQLHDSELTKVVITREDINLFLSQENASLEILQWRHDEEHDDFEFRTQVHSSTLEGVARSFQRSVKGDFLVACTKDASMMIFDEEREDGFYIQAETTFGLEQQPRLLIASQDGFLLTAVMPDDSI